MMRSIFAFLFCMSFVCAVHAHDTWVQINTNLVRTGDAVHIDLMLGNHGNEHRDYKLASKIPLKNCSLEVIAPDGVKFDVKDRLIDAGYTPAEGFWTTRFTTKTPGLYLVGHTCDTIASYAPVRNIKGAKACFVASNQLDKVPTEHKGFDRVLGHPLELVPTSDPVTPMGPEIPIRVQLLLNGKPLAKARVAFIPRGVTLSEGFDDRYERTTDADGKASFTPTEGNYYLVAAHHEDSSLKGKGYEKTKYSATLSVFVPALCPCCE